MSDHATELAGLESRIRELAPIVNAWHDLLPTFGRTEDGARPHLERDDRGWHFVVVERGEELERRITGDRDEVLWLVFESVTFGVAVPYASRHRIPGQDFRRQLFARQEELLGRISGEWAARAARDHAATLAKHPFVDHPA